MTTLTDFGHPKNLIADQLPDLYTELMQKYVEEINGKAEVIRIQ